MGVEKLGVEELCHSTTVPVCPVKVISAGARPLHIIWVGEMVPPEEGELTVTVTEVQDEA
jgi:hypothetical protein